MNGDPNADLIGFTFNNEAGTYRVVGSAKWNPAYVTVERLSNGMQTVRVASQVRSAKLAQA